MKLTQAAAIMAAALLAGCAQPRQAATEPATALQNPPAASGIQQPPAPAAAIAPPSASQPDLAIAAVKGYHPPGSKDSVQDFITAATILSSLSSFKEVGWGAEPLAGSVLNAGSSGAWKVTNVYVGSEAVERRAEWRVTLTPRVVTALNAPARDMEAHARRLAGMSGKK